MTKGDREAEQSREVLRDATVEELLAAFTSVVQSGGTNNFCVENIAHRAADMPFSAKFRDALRSRRDKLDDGGRRAFDYFAKHGDESDLKWMEGVVEYLKDYRLAQAEESINKLRERLASEGQ